jgi:hypothetical protein
MKLKINDSNSYKIGVDEIEGLHEILVSLLKPIQDHIKESVYWSDVEIESTEYKSRDGFIPYRENCGGVQIMQVIPKCEEYKFSFLDFGQCDECGDSQCGYNGQECASESEGHLDAKLRIWLKFEGLQDGTMHFYLYCGGGNGDAPYFRTKYEHDVFEAEFTAKTLAELRKIGKLKVKELLNKLA